MPSLAKAGPQTGLSRETTDVYEKKRQVEDFIRAVDSKHKLLTESAAQRDIEAYLKNHPALAILSISH
jgi:hypothetical protein